ncbi:polysaccharide biosynthesis tyrosine autokinase [Brachymonas sp. M4Q-1]|uniref:polysaccharide biosynthesis tyrosine autokinase n=1 Tax=Brachymonas sp. M4Q-1 TaxID=3416906 RepID=UPI003CF35981
MSSTTHTASRTQETDDEIDLRKLFHAILINRFWIVLSLLVGLVLGVIYAFATTPVYQANALLQIEPKNKNSLLGDLKNLPLGGDTKGDADAEIQIIRSRLVLGNTVSALHLATEPVYVPPPFYTRMFADSAPRQPRLGLEQFVAPAALHHEKFSIVFKDAAGHYQLTLPSGKEYTGSTGNVLSTPEGVVVLLAPSAVQTGDVFEVRPVSEQEALERLSKNLMVGENGKNTNILGLQLNDYSPDNARRVLDTIVDLYVKQNREYAAQVDGASLGFLEQQLPKTREALDRAENAYNAYRHKNATVDVTVESKGLIEGLNQLEMQLTDLKVKETEVTRLYTPDHPMAQAIAEKKQILEKARKQLLSKIEGMPGTQQDVIRLKRNVDIQQAIYLQLLNKQQELGISQASKIGNVRVIDRAQTLDKPVKPQKALVILAATLGLGFLAVLVVIMRTLFRQGIDDAEDLESIGIPVLASVPFSEIQRKRDKILKYLRKRNKNVRSDFLLAASKPDDIAVEALRALRTSLYFSMMEARNNILMVTGATLKVGKTFISANLATVMAQSGKRVVLIDADMRKGYLHELLRMEVEDGLADYLAQSGEGKPHVRATEVANLSFLSQGHLKDGNNPAELLGHARMQTLLEQLAAEFDYVILDAPPALAVTDANILGQHAGTVIGVTRFEMTTLKEVEMMLSRLSNNHIALTGTILNGIQRTAATYHTYKAYTHYKKDEA